MADSGEKTLDRLLETMQDLFILQALQLGAKGENVRKHVKVDQWRVTKVSQLLKTGKKSPK
jgi:hypothetical protein